MAEKIHPEVLKRIEADLKSAKFRRNFVRTYKYKDEQKTREQQILRPKLYVTVPKYDSERTPPFNWTFHTHITNRGGTTSLNAVVKLVGRKGSSYVTEELDRRIIPVIAVGQTITQDLFLDNTQHPGVLLYGVVCFDPLFDPIQQDIYGDLQPISDLLNLSRTSVWEESQLDANYNETSHSNTWTIDRGDRRSRYIRTLSTTDDSPQISQLKQIVDMTNPYSYMGIDKSDLTVFVGGLLNLQEGRNKPRVQVGFDFLDSAGRKIASQFVPVQFVHVTSLGYEFRVSSQPIPAYTSRVALRLICDKRHGHNVGNVSFSGSSMDMWVTHRLFFFEGRY